VFRANAGYVSDDLIRVYLAKVSRWQPLPT
jgi:hypothetical protein